VIRVVFDVEGDILRDLQNLQSGSKPAAKRVFQKFVDRVVPKARALAPDDPTTEGVDLKASIRGRVTVRTAGMVTASVIAGGNPLLPLLAMHRRDPDSATRYAIIQHEDTTLHHTHGQANFVGQPFMEEAQRVGDDLDVEVLSARA
jgi:hypothetical protein